MEKSADSKRYLLGEDQDGMKYFLEKPSWDCEWYWGFGYIESRDSHQHANGEFIAGNAAGTGHSYNSDTDIFTGDFLVKKTFSQEEGWALRELMAQFYTFRKMADLYTLGGAHISGSWYGEQWKDKDKAEDINNNVIPKITKQIGEILTPVRK